MSKIRSAFLGLPVAVLAIAGMSFHTQGPGAQDLSQVIGVVNLRKARAAYPKAVASDEQLRQENERFQELRKQREDAIQQLQLDMMALDASAQVQRAQKSLQIDLARQELEGSVAIHQNDLLARGAALQVQIYEDIAAAAAKVAQAKGLKLVLRVRELPAGAPLDYQQAFHDRRNVLYHAAELDLTEDVLNMLK